MNSIWSALLKVEANVESQLNQWGILMLKRHTVEAGTGGGLRIGQHIHVAVCAAIGLSWRHGFLGLYWTLLPSTPKRSCGHRMNRAFYVLIFKVSDLQYFHTTKEFGKMQKTLKFDLSIRVASPPTHRSVAWCLTSLPWPNSHTIEVYQLAANGDSSDWRVGDNRAYWFAHTASL